MGFDQEEPYNTARISKDRVPSSEPTIQRLKDSIVASTTQKRRKDFTESSALARVHLSYAFREC
ncbi:uncharacterized protein RSE6_07213 [Rhynchosporium secalis]|uniref:Uncharacterized protein n=1 Tax=Rhynchosporium secalis TaxID=38038 RepID=A0A1E1MCC2_RHYSE|nr:uncharacterized protein RSE6_07213 [Rhynchosporium secalis]